MIERSKQQEGALPYFVVADSAASPTAEVLLYHGWGSDASRQCFRAHLLASFGYRVTVPEIPNHGERGTAAYEDGVSSPLFFKTLVQSIEESRIFLENVMDPSLPRFVVGHSLGGMIAIGAITQASLDGVIALNSTIDWSHPVDLLEGVYEDGATAQAACMMAQDINWSRLLDHSPEAWSHEQAKTPILLTNGELDTTMPLRFNEDFLKKHSHIKAQHLIIPDAGHVVTDSALREAVAFIEEHR